MALELKIDGIDAGYGAVRALHGVSLHVKAGETVALLGTNGNGKSTLMKCVMGMVRPTRGSVFLSLDGRKFDLTKLSTNSRQIFADQSSHFINFDQPELVIEGIRQVVNSARSLQRQSSNEHRPQLSSDTCGLACTKVLQMHKPV